MMNKYLINLNSSLKKAMDQLDKVNGIGLIVVNDDHMLKGTMTDGDIRRALIAGATLETPVDKIMHQNPTSVDESATADDLAKITENKIIKIVPIVRSGVVVNVFVSDTEQISDIPVVLMAGGLGTRLGEHTKECPKPMLDVGGKPVLERIIENFTRVGFRRFYLSVNYKAEVIEEYFKNGENHSCAIKYIKEDKRLGTAGSLSLLPTEIKGPVLVMNGDLLTHIDFRRLVSFHEKHNSPITMCTRRYEFQVPYGVVNIDEGQAKSFDEKPMQTFNVNAGVYIVDAELTKYIPKDCYYDMPTFLHDLLAKGISTYCFPMIETWIDIGQVSDLKYARQKFED